MCLLKSKCSWLVAPALWLLGILIILTVWLVATPEWVMRHFDQDGGSPVEVATIGLFFAQIGFFWLVPPMPPGRRRTLFLLLFSLITLFAICRELDWHKLLISTPDLPGMTRGTPFKLKYLTNPHNPPGSRLTVAACFLVAFAVCGGTLFYYLPRLLKGLFRFHPVCWSIAFLGGTGILSQFFDRIPAELRHHCGVHLTASGHALTTALEEGQELFLPIFVMLATLQAHFIYNNDPADSITLQRHKNL